MFTGIIEEVGTVSRVQRSGSSSFIEIQAKKVLEDVHLGDSIAVNGVCLTVTHFGGGTFRADVMNETLSRSSLGSLTSGSPVNLERAMAAGGRFGGHIVSGHIDGTGTVSDISNDGIAVWYTISASPALLRLSLTVAKVTDTAFSVSIIPHTAAQTILGSKKVGDIVNLENDIIGKYVEKLMKPADDTPKQSNITMDFLMKNGF